MTAFIPSLTLPAFLFQQPAAAVLLPIAAGTAVAIFLSPRATSTTYACLRQPPLKPPAWLFGPVWTTLYGMMGYSAHRAWSVGMSSFDPRIVALTKHGANLYSLQLVLNLAWTPLFFGLKKPVAASVDIIALTGTVAYLVYLWGQVDALSGWLLAPYLVWLGFANYLCHGCGYLNGWKLDHKPKHA